jgi:hypothetical protein
MSQYRLVCNIPLILAMLVLATVAQVQAGTVLVGSDAAMDSGQGQLILGCNNLEVAGEISGRAIGAGNVSILSGGSLSTDLLSFSGDWENAGQAEVPGSVRWLDGCEVLDAQMAGNTVFSALEIHSTDGRTVRLLANATQHVTDSLILEGAADSLLTLRSTAPGQHAGLTLAPAGSQSIAFVDVADMNSSGGQTMAPGSPDLYDSIDSGNNVNWFRGISSAIPVSTLGLIGTMLLVLLIALMGLDRARHTRESNEGMR